MRTDTLDDSRKRPAASEPTDGLNTAKRQRLDAEVHEPLQTPSPHAPLPEGPVTLAQLYTLTQDENHKAYDVTPIPKFLLDRIIVPVLGSIDEGRLNNALDVSAMPAHETFQLPSHAAMRVAVQFAGFHYANC